MYIAMNLNLIIVETPSQPQQFFSELPHGATASLTSSVVDSFGSFGKTR